MPGIDCEMAGVKTDLSPNATTAKQHLTDERAALRPVPRCYEVGR